MYFVYILYSESQKLYYKGFSENVKSRVEEHNAGKSRYTCNKGPWKLIFVQSFPTKKEALQREKSLKKWLKLSRISKVNYSFKKHILLCI
jgi:putative endonuclease